ncbi:hypothetical protein D3C77_564320 [compost metagenome]
MPHVGVERFGAGQRQHHRAQNRHPHAWVQHEELHRPHRVERLQHFRALDDAMQAQCTQHDEPQHHDRPEEGTDARGAVLLDQKQRHQHHHRQRHHPMLDAVEGQLQPFNGR